MSELPLCACREVYQSHHPWCPARRAYKRLQSEVRALEQKRVKLNRGIGERDEEIEHLRNVLQRLRDLPVDACTDTLMGYAGAVRGICQQVLRESGPHSKSQEKRLVVQRGGSLPTGDTT